jgi:NhaP-type Na+/H+ or K+/H+ antiporter
MVICFFIIEGIMHKYHPKIGHETGVTIMVGVIFSIAYYYGHGQTAKDWERFQFNPDIFFNLILPPIVFNAGYNMRQKKFFTNLGNIMITGLCVTFVCFAIYSAATYFVIKHMNLTMSRYVDNLNPGALMPETYPIEMSFMAILMFTSLLCSSDVVAAVSIIDFSKAPKLYSCVFGEGVFNDIVSIVLFNTVKMLQKAKFTAATPFIIIAQFIVLALVSISIGAAYGFFTCLLFKHFRFFTSKAVNEKFMMFGIGLLSYFTSNGIIIMGVEMSGLISLLVFAII